MQDAFGVEKRQVLGREMYTSNDPSDPGFNTRVAGLQGEYDKWESAQDYQRKSGLGPAHAASGKNQTRWLKEMDAHAADPVRRAEMQYAAKNNLDYPLKKKPAPVRSQRKEMAVSKSAFGIDHGEISKGLPSSLRGMKSVKGANKYVKNRVRANAYGKRSASWGESSDPYFVTRDAVVEADRNAGRLARAKSRISLQKKSRVSKPLPGEVKLP